MIRKKEHVTQELKELEKETNDLTIKIQDLIEIKKKKILDQVDEQYRRHYEWLSRQKAEMTSDISNYFIELKDMIRPDIFVSLNISHQSSKSLDKAALNFDFLAINEDIKIQIETISKKGQEKIQSLKEILEKVYLTFDEELFRNLKYMHFNPESPNDLIEPWIQSLR